MNRRSLIKIIRYIERNSGNDNGRIYDTEFDRESNKGTFRFIPNMYDMEELPEDFVEMFKKAGLNITNTFKQDFGRTHGYRDYHDCIVTDNGYFNGNIASKFITEER